MIYILSLFFFFNDTATTEIYTLSLHDALPIFGMDIKRVQIDAIGTHFSDVGLNVKTIPDRKSTRLNSSHQIISYAVFCLKKKKKKTINIFCINNHKSEYINLDYNIISYVSESD